MRRAFFVFAALAILASPAVIYAAGPHDNDCTECHSLHETVASPAFRVAPNTTEKYVGTGQTVSGTDALCLGCHNEDEGIIPIHLMKSHPVGKRRTYLRQLPRSAPLEPQLQISEGRYQRRPQYGSFLRLLPRGHGRQE
jgi:hypothetical protein